MKPTQAEFYDKLNKADREPKTIDVWKAGVYAIVTFWIGFFIGNCVEWM